MKTNKTISLDVDLVELSKIKGIKLSTILNDYLKEYLLVDETKIPKEKDLLVQEKTEMQVKQKLIDNKLRKFKDQEQKEIQERIRKKEEYDEKVRKGLIVEVG